MPRIRISSRHHRISRRQAANLEHPKRRVFAGGSWQQPMRRDTLDEPYERPATLADKHRE